MITLPSTHSPIPAQLRFSESLQLARQHVEEAAEATYSGEPNKGQAFIIGVSCSPTPWTSADTHTQVLVNLLDRLCSGEFRATCQAQNTPLTPTDLLLKLKEKMQPFLPTQ